MVELSGSKVLFGSLLLFFATAAVVYSENYHNDKQYQPYKGAIYEHIAAKPKSLANITRYNALRVINDNLERYRDVLKGENWVRFDIIVFPEYGLFGVLNYSHDSIHPFLEAVPEVRYGNWSPCTETKSSDDYVIQKALSCMAKEYKVYIVAGLGEKSECVEEENYKCRSHNFNHYSTTVVFSKEGNLVAKYRRKALFDEPYFDSPREFNIAVFETDQNKFAVVSSYDTMLKEPVTELIKKRKVKNIIVPNVWRSQSPLLSSVQWHYSWAVGNVVNVLAATVYDRSICSYGSGIYTPNRKSKYRINLDFTKGMLLSQTIKRTPSSKIKTAVFSHVSQSSGSFTYHNIQLLGQSVKFKFIEMKKKKDNVSICSGSFCCQVDYYQDSDESDRYSLGIFKGYITALNRKLSFEICTVLVCNSECGTSLVSQTYFSSFVLFGFNFIADHIYPQMVLMGDEGLKLNEDYDYEHGKIILNDVLSHPMISATLIGRVYQEDKSLQNENPTNNFSKDRKPHGTSTAKRNDAVSGFTPTVFVIGMASVLLIIHFS